MNQERDRAKLTVTHPSRHVGISISLIGAKRSLSQGDEFLELFRESRGIAEMSIVMNGDSAVWTVADLFYQDCNRSQSSICCDPSRYSQAYIPNLRYHTVATQKADELSFVSAYFSQTFS